MSDFLLFSADDYNVRKKIVLYKPTLLFVFIKAILDNKKMESLVFRVGLCFPVFGCLSEVFLHSVSAKRWCMLKTSFESWCQRTSI